MSPSDFQLIFLILFALLALYLKLKGKVLGLLNAEAEPHTPKALKIYTALTLALSALIFLLSLLIILLIVDIRTDGLPGRSGDGGAGLGIGMFVWFVGVWLTCAAGISLVLNLIQLGTAYYFKSRKQMRLGWISVALLLPLITFVLHFFYQATYSEEARRHREESLRNSFSERERRHARAQTAINSGELEQAAQLIQQLPNDCYRVSLLFDLADGLHAKGGKQQADRAFYEAVSLVKEDQNCYLGQSSEEYITSLAARFSLERTPDWHQSLKALKPKPVVHTAPDPARLDAARAIAFEAAVGLRIQNLEVHQYQDRFEVTGDTSERNDEIWAFMSALQRHTLVTRVAAEDMKTPRAGDPQLTKFRLFFDFK